MTKCEFKEQPCLFGSRFRAFVRISCPEHGLCCTTPEQMEDASRRDEWRGILGWVGSDIIFLQSRGITKFPNMVSQDMFSFATEYRIYLYTNNKFYELDEKNKKLIAMNVDFYERYKY